MRKIIQQLYAVQGKPVGKYFPGLNGAKGLLVLMVVMTHCLPKSMILFFMYLFHMPVFMAFSGFLLKTAAFDNGLKAYLKKVWHRLLIPWLIASVIFLPLEFKDGSILHFNIHHIIYPYYHLWYIPSYLIGAIVCYFIYKLKIPSWLILLFFGLVSIFWYNVYRDIPTPVNELPLYWLGDKRLFAYLFFFIGAFCIRNRYITPKITANQTLALLFFSFAALVVLVLFHGSSWSLVWPYMIFNSALVIFVLVYVAPNNWLENKILLYISENSLGIYLYHPLFQMLIYILLKDPEQKHISNIGALGVFLLVMLLNVGLISVLKKWSFTDKYFLGNIKR